MMNHANDGRLGTCEHITERVEALSVSADCNIEDALAQLDRAGVGILLLVDGQRRLLGTLTDGDFRRAILHKVPLRERCAAIANMSPVCAPLGVSASEALRIMDHGCGFVVNHLPLVDDNGVVEGLLLRRDLVSDEAIDLTAMVMAGGYGMRLRPLTESVPKPMLLVGGRPLMEHILEQLKKTGIRRINVATHYLAESISEYFGDGSSRGLDIRYVNEDEPLGTAGAVGLIERTETPILVMNGDVLTRVDFRAMLAFHQEHSAALTVGVRQHAVTIPFGVVETDGARIRHIEEKPTVRSLVNAGIYLLAPHVLDHLQDAKRMDMPDLIRALIATGETVVSFPVWEYWKDIGQLTDYHEAQVEFNGEGA